MEAPRKARRRSVQSCSPSKRSMSTRRSTSPATAYDNALAETTIGLYKSECTANGSPFRDGSLATLGDVEKITSSWVHWYNTGRLMHRTGLRPPAEADARYWAGQA